MSPVVRPATLADLPALLALVQSAYRGESARAGWTHEADLLNGQRTDEAALRDILSDPDQRMLVTVSDAGLDGCVVVQRKGSGAYLGMLTVRPDLQGQGLGRVLMAAAEGIARDLFGANMIEMTVIRQRKELVAWYERRGYVLTGERRPFPHHDPRFGLPVRPDLEFVVLVKALTA